MTPKDIREKRASLHSQMTAIVDKARNEKRNMTAEENAQFDAIDTDINQLGEQLARLEKHEAHAKALNSLQPVQQDNIGAGAAQQDAGRKDAYQKAFDRYMRVGVQNLSGEEQSVLRAGYVNDPQAALTTTTTGGGYLIPQGFSDQLDEAQKWFGGIDQFCEVMATETGNPIPFPTANDTGNVGEIVGVNTQVSQAYPTFGQVMFNAYKFSSKLVLVPLELAQDSYFDLNAYLAKQLGTRLARIKNNKFTVGSGTNEPTGVVTAAAAAGNILPLATGNTATISSDNLIDLEHSVDRAYRSGAKYMLHDLTLKAIKKLKDSQGRPLWLPGLAAGINGGFPDTVNGYQYIINNDMAQLGASNYSVAFGDVTKFKVRRVAGYTVLRLTERYADYGQVGFLCFERADSNLVDAGTHPIALLQNSAS